MSSTMPPIAVIPKQVAAGNQMMSSMAEPATGDQTIPGQGENNPFTQLLSQFVQDQQGVTPLTGDVSGLQGGVVEQILPEQGSVLPLEGKLLPQNLLAATDSAADNLVDLPLEGVPLDTETGTASLYTSDQDPLGLLVNDLTKLTGRPVSDPLAATQSGQLPASAGLMSASVNRVTTDPSLQAAQANSVQDPDGLKINLGDTAMQSDPEPGRKDNFLQAVQEMRLTSLPQAQAEASTQTLAAGRETVASLVNTSASPAAVVTDAVRPSVMQTLSLDGPLNRPEWRDEMASRVSWLVRNDQSSAQLRINPAHLGPMEISIKMTQDQASVSFVSQHIQVREAVEQAIPRLREMLEQQGLNLTDVDISSGYSTAGQAGSDAADETEVSDSERAHNSPGSSEGSDGEDLGHTLTGELEMDQGAGVLDEYV